MKKTELVFIPTPGMGHLASTVELAKLLTDRNEQLSITVLIMKFPSERKVSSYTNSQEEASDSRIRFLDLKRDESSSQTPSSPLFMYQLIEDHKSSVREILTKVSNSPSSDLAGIVIDMFCATMIDVAEEFRVPSYLFFTSGAGMLGLMFHLQSLRDDLKEDITDYDKSKVELDVPTFINPVPVKLFPTGMFDKDGNSDAFLNLAKRYRETKGIVINTFVELESHAVQALSNDKTIPPVYAVGPVLNLKRSNGQNQETDIIMKWLDHQPDCSVVFLCFGSGGCFDGDQVHEIAYALERSGYRFLWSLRRPPPQGKYDFPREYENLEEVLPEGFLQRTAEVGKVMGWAPQAAVLSHPAVGGFVSHCGWNSTLESIWYGIPIAAWPLYSEQQLNAFLMMKDLEMAVEIKMDFKKSFREASTEIVAADVIIKGIKHLIDPENEIRNKVKEMKDKSRLTLSEGGSSSASLGRFLGDVIDNVP